MSHIFLRPASGAGTAGTLSVANLDFWIFTENYWYLDSFIQFTNYITDINAGTFDNVIVTYDYGSF